MRGLGGSWRGFKCGMRNAKGAGVGIAADAGGVLGLGKIRNPKSEIRKGGSFESSCRCGGKLRMDMGLFAFEGVALGGVEFFDGGGGEVEHFLELFGGEGGVLAGALDFDEGVVGEHGDVHVDVGFDVFDVVEIGDGSAVDDSYADGSDLIGEN